LKRIITVSILLVTLILGSTLPVGADTYSNTPWGSSSLGKIHRKAAVVGKVIAYSQETESYVVFGRLSIDSGQGYQVYERRKFYRVYPRWGETGAQLNKNLGNGLKLFGTYELSTGTGNEEKLLAEKAVSYDPAADIKAGEEPAYGSGVGPYDWIGFGVPVITEKAFNMTVNKSSDIVNNLALIRDSIGVGSGGNANQVLNTLKPDPTKKLREAWQSYEISWFMEKDLDTLNQMGRAVGGSAYLCGLSGGKGTSNIYLEQVPLLRPQIDTFMKAVETAELGQFKEWACPAVFYGMVTPKFDKDEQKQSLFFDGVYFRDDEPGAMITAMSSREGINKETWKIKGLSLSNDDIKGACWFSGQRVLVYEYTDNEGESHITHVYDGSFKDDPEYTLVDCYITVNKLLTKSEYNLMLDLTRELAMRGGI